MNKRTGYCECGCGEKTTVNLYNNTAYGYKKGEPKRFVMGHSSRLIKSVWNKKSYKSISHNGKLIRLHRHLMQEKIGRKLSRNEHVHHINGDFTDNRIENLELLSPRAHAHVHRPEKEKPDLVCIQCKKLFRPKRKGGKSKIGILQWSTRKLCSYDCTYAWRRENGWGSKDYTSPSAL